jgi:hypothetical protein
VFETNEKRKVADDATVAQRKSKTAPAIGVAFLFQ